MKRVQMILPEMSPVVPADRAQFTFGHNHFALGVLTIFAGLVAMTGAHEDGGPLL
ncbi:MAG TPA: hypothetical protein VII66_07885 [Gemmatimonadaceae bacterium]